MLNRIGRFLTVFLLVFFCRHAFCSEIFVEANVSQDTVGIEDNFIYSVKVESGDNATDFNIITPSFEKFDLVSTSKSTSLSIINGEVTRGTIYNYILKARETGVFTIDESSLEYSGKSYKTRPVRVTVKEGSLAKSPGGRQSPFFSPDPFESLFERRPETRRRAISKEDGFVELSVSNENPYIYEQVVLTVSFYKKPDLVGEASLNPVQIPDAWMEEVDPDSYQDAGYTMKNNQRYALYKIHYVFYPTKSGELVIPGAKINFTPVSFFSASPASFESGNRVLNVKPLPEGRMLPVGKFSLDISLEEKDEYFQNQPFTLKVLIKGTGRLRENDIRIDDMDGKFEIYPPRRSVKNQFQDRQLTISTEAEYVVIPRESGNIPIPEVLLEYFDPADRSLKRISSRELKLDFLPSRAKDHQSGYTYHDVKKEKGDIHYLMQFNPRSDLPLSGIFPRIVLYLLAVSALISAVAGILRNKASCSRAVHTRKARQKAIKGIKKTDVHGDKRKSAKNMLGILYSYIDRGYNIQASSLTREEIRARLREACLDPAVSNGVTDIMEYLSNIAYNPGYQQDADIEPVRKKIQEMLNKKEI